jgi:hypothetical protein
LATFVNYVRSPTSAAVVGRDGLLFFRAGVDGDGDALRRQCGWATAMAMAMRAGRWGDDADGNVCVDQEFH